MLFAFHFIIACHAMFFESLLIYYLFHFFHFPFFCMLFLLFLPFLQSSVPVCRHNGDDRTGSSRLVSRSCFSYFSALLSGKTSLGRGGKKGRRSLQGKTTVRVDGSWKYTMALRPESLSALGAPVGHLAAVGQAPVPPPRGNGLRVRGSESFSAPPRYRGTASCTKKKSGS